MTIREDVPLAPHTTLHIGGPARAFTEVQSEDDIRAALEAAATRGLPIRVLGAGSNILASDAGIEALIVHMGMRGIRIEERGDEALLIAEAGARWDDAVDAATTRGLFGLENLAGIPGTVGGAVVQNIGAYGAELASVFAYAETINAVTREHTRLERADAAFAYRTSLFKQRPNLIIVRAVFKLSRGALPLLSYPDLVREREAGTPLATPAEIARAVRIIRARKFPDLSREGTAGSFFKNPIVSAAEAASLVARYPELPNYVQADGTRKLSLAWLLDHALTLKGFARGAVRLYEQQPLVLVTRSGATAAAVHAFADDIASRVLHATDIRIEREVETFVAHHE